MSLSLAFPTTVLVAFTCLLTLSPFQSAVDNVAIVPVSLIPFVLENVIPLSTFSVDAVPSLALNAFHGTFNQYEVE